jgi:hypothetical protein
LEEDIRHEFNGRILEHDVVIWLHDDSCGRIPEHSANRRPDHLLLAMDHPENGHFGWGHSDHTAATKTTTATATTATQGWSCGK